MASNSVSVRGLERYVPRVASEWDIDAPGAMWQEIDSTLCFVDLSGFTKLSERLARRGRIGAEELTDVLDHAFGRMLDAAYAHSGSLLKFGGDALLLHFAGEAHEVRGASSAIEMRAELADAARVTTSVGRVPLRMSVGVHSGPITMFRVGESHKELIIAGPGSTRVVQMESAADAGEIVLSPELAARLPADALGAPKGPGTMLRWRRGRAEPMPPTVRHDLAPDLYSRCLPGRLRQFLVEDVIEPEHRVATVGFVKFEGVDELIAQSPTVAAEALDEVITTVQRAIDAAGVTFLASDVDKDGGKVILITGFPATQDDDEGRMMRAVREIVDAGTRLPVRVGVNRGHVFAGEVGAEHRATFTVIGDTVNLAARLMASAPQRHIYAAPNVLDRSRALFETEALEPFYVKGKAQPVQAYSVGRYLGPRTATAHELPFTGRGTELATLVAAIDAARGGVGDTMAVVGPTGSGKTRLIDEAVRVAGAITTIEAHAEQEGSSAAYRGLRDPVRKVLGIDRADQPTMARQLTVVIEAAAPHLMPLLPLLADVTHIEVPSTPTVDSIEVRFRPDRTAAALVELLDVMIDDPLLLVFEDAQWSDSATSTLIARLTTAVATRPWLMLAVHRSDHGHVVPSTIRTVELVPLSADEAEAIVRAVTAAAPLRPHEVKILVQRSAGSPLFLGELLQMARTGGIDEMPASLDAVVGAEIDALGVLARRLVRYASVLGRSFRVEVLREMLADDEIELDDSTNRQLGRFLEYEGTERVRFRHAVHREVAYEGLTYRRRRELHLRAGAITERMAGNDVDTVADLLAMHYSLAQEHERAWVYSRVAGDRARSRYANLEAALQYERALDSGRRLSSATHQQLAEVWRVLGDVREQLGMFEDAIDAYRKATALLIKDSIEVADLMWRRARARMHLGAYRVAMAEASKGRRLVDRQDDAQALAVRARLTSLQALLRQAQQRARPARTLARQAIDEARTAEDPAALARAYLVAEWADRMLGSDDDVPYGEMALRLYEQIGDLDGAGKASNNQGAIAYFDGRWDDAIASYRQALDYYSRCGNDATAAVAGSNLGELLVSRRNFDEAETTLLDAIRTMRAAHALDDVLFAEIQFGRLLLERGDASEAIDYLRLVGEEAAGLGQVGYAFEASMLLASAQSALGDHQQALATLDHAVVQVGHVDPVYEATLGRVRASALAGAGQVFEARSALVGALDTARDQGLTYDEALILLAIGELGGDGAGDATATGRAILARLNVSA